MLTDFRLKVFYTAAIRKSFTKAARDLNISQPAVSQNIAELEQQVGDTLFERLPGGIIPTAKGEILLRYAEKILHLYDSINSELIPSNCTPLAPIRIAACPIAVRFILPQVIERFRAVRPTAEVHLFECSEEEAANAVIEGTADIGVIQSESEELATTPFATLTLSETGKSMLELFFAYRPDSDIIDSIKNFILTAKTSI